MTLKQIIRLLNLTLKEVFLFFSASLAILFFGLLVIEFNKYLWSNHSAFTTLADLHKL